MRGRKSVNGTPADTRSRLLFTGYLFLMMIAYAFSVTMIGPIMPLAIRQYGLSLAKGGLFLTFMSAGGVTAILTGSLISDRLRKSAVIGLCFLAYGILLLTVGLQPSYILLLALFFLIGASTRFMDAMSNAFIADLYPHNRSRALNLLHTFFGIGGFLGPLYAQWIVSGGFAWNAAFLFLGVVSVFMAVFYFPFERRVSVPSAAGGADDPAGDPLSVQNGTSAGKSPLSHPGIWVLFLMMLLYMAHQSGMTAWIPMFMESSLGSSPFVGSLSLSLLWIGIIGGRFTVSSLGNRFDPVKIIIAGSLVGGIVLTPVFFLGRPVLVPVASAVAGFSTGAVIPLLVTIGTGWFPRRSGTVSSLIFLSGTLSRMFFPWFIGLTAERVSFPLAISLSGFSLIGLFLLALVVNRLQPGRR